MTVAVPPSLNGRPRKQLSEQLDRLDEVINGLEEFLSQAVAEATRDGVRQAFRDVVSEIVTDPATLERLRTALMPEVMPMTVVQKPSAFGRLKAFLRGVAGKTAVAVTVCKAVVTMTRHRVMRSVARRCASVKCRVARWTLLSLPVKSIVVVSLVIGVVAATVSYFAPHHIAAVISGTGAMLTALVVQVGNCLRRRLATFALI